jgi:hypothetical protein
MKVLFRTQSVIVGLIGGAFVVFPSPAISLLFGSAILPQSNTLAARATGAVLLLFAFTCWGWGNRDRSQMNYLASVMLFYDVAMALAMIYTRFERGLTGTATWPFIAVHFGLAAWCFVNLVNRPRTLGIA